MVSIPVSARRQASANQLGNHVGVVPVQLPGTGDPLGRLETVAARSRTAKQASPGGSTPLLGAAFRLLAQLGLFRWFIDRQRLVHTFVTNLRGPESRLAFLDAPITDVIPIAVVTGNVTVSFAVLSYAGTLGITVMSDPAACPDLDTLRAALQDQLGQLDVPAT